MTILVLPGNGRPSESQVLRPMMMGCPKVSDLKRLRSSGRRHGSALPAPITRFLATAAIKVMRSVSFVEAEGIAVSDGIAALS